MNRKREAHMKWRCHPLIWSISLLAGVSIISFSVIFLVDSLRNSWWLGVFVALFICMALIYQLLMLPTEVTINADLLTIKWPWQECKVRRDDIRRIIFRQYWLKTVHVLILRKQFTLRNLIPVLLVWEMQPSDAPNIAGAIDSWWESKTFDIQSAVPTNEQVTLRNPWKRIFG